MEKEYIKKIQEKKLNKLMIVSMYSLMIIVNLTQ